MGAKISVNNSSSQSINSKKRPSVANAFKHSIHNFEKQQQKRQQRKRSSSPLPRVVSSVKEAEPRLSTGSSMTDLSLLCFNTTQLGEDDRMNANHFALKALFEGNMPDTLSKNIDFNSPSTKVLDIGCGSGSWIMDMATEFPSAQFVGIDQATLFPHDIRPANVSFQKQDILLGLPFEDNSFDLVQMRLFALAFTRSQWEEALKEAYRVTKPGGYVQLLEAQLVDPGDEVVQSFVEKVKTIMEGNDQDPEVCNKLSPLLQKAGYTPVEEVRKAIPLQNHVLSAEFMYIISISMDSCKRFFIEIYDIQSELEFQELKKLYIESRRKTSESAWCCSVGQKPLSIAAQE